MNGGTIETPIGRLVLKKDVNYMCDNGASVTIKKDVLYDFYDDNCGAYMLVVCEEKVYIYEDDGISYLQYFDGILFVATKHDIDDSENHTLFRAFKSYRVLNETEYEYKLYSDSGLVVSMPKHMFFIDSISGFDFEIYQQNTAKTAIYPKDNELQYIGFGIVGEAGELANKLKKIFRDSGGKITDEKRDEILEEVGDILWYSAQICNMFDKNMNTLARQNLSKLRSRQSKNTLHGSGDKR